MNKEKKLARIAMKIVNHLYELAELSVEKRQSLNDKADDFVYAELLLLNKPTGAITESAHFANTDVGRSAANSDTLNNIERSQADSSETSVVGQNEQTKKVCQDCCAILSTDNTGMKCPNIKFIQGKPIGCVRQWLL